MLQEVVSSKQFIKLMNKHIEELLYLLFESNQNFGILCKIKHVTFDPELPEEIVDEFREMTLFFLAGYTFESSIIEDDALKFEAGFGKENIGSIVTVPLLSIVQIIVDETPIFVNMASPTESQLQLDPAPEEQGDAMKNSMAAFLSHPENQKFFNK